MRHSGATAPRGLTSAINRNLGAVYFNMWKHGTSSGYKHHKCRCDECRKAFMAERKRRRDNPPKNFKHGRGAYVAYGCRCEICVTAQREYKKKLYRKNPKKNNERNKKYKEEHREELLQYWRDYNKTDTRKKSNKKYIEGHKEQIAESTRKYRLAHIEELKAKGAEYRKSEKGKAKYHEGNRRHRNKKLSLPGSHTDKEFIELCAKYGNRCLCCGRTDLKLTEDHIIPITWEGSTDNIDNIQPLCSRCNAKKGNFRDTDYRPKWNILT